MDLEILCASSSTHPSLGGQARAWQEVTALLSVTPAPACQASSNRPCSPETSGPVCVTHPAMSAVVAYMTSTKKTAPLPSFQREAFLGRGRNRTKKRTTKNNNTPPPHTTQHRTHTSTTNKPKTTTLTNTNYLVLSYLVFNGERIWMYVPLSVSEHHFYFS